MATKPRRSRSEFLIPNSNARSGGADRDVGTHAGLTLVAARDSLCRVRRSRHIGQRDRTAAESTAGHPRAVNAAGFRRESDHRVQLAAAHFVIVAQAGMRLAHQVAERPEVAVDESARGLPDTRVL